MATTTSEEFEKATDFQFKEDDIERAKSLVGHWGALGGAGVPDHGDAGLHAQLCPELRGRQPTLRFRGLRHDDALGGQIAPPMIPIALNRPLYADPPKERIKRPSFRGIHVFVSGSTWQWFRSLLEGDSLYSFGGTESVVEKKSEFAERSLLVTYASVKINQRAEIVAISRDAGHPHGAQSTAGTRASTRPSSRRPTPTRTSRRSTPSTKRRRHEDRSLDTGRTSTWETP